MLAVRIINKSAPKAALARRPVRHPPVRQRRVEQVAHRPHQLRLLLEVDTEVDCVLDQFFYPLIREERVEPRVRTGGLHITARALLLPLASQLFLDLCFLFVSGGASGAPEPRLLLLLRRGTGLLVRLGDGVLVGGLEYRVE